MHLVRRLTVSILGNGTNEAGSLSELRDAGVPITDAPCRICPEPCEEGHEGFSKRFDVDMESDMRGSVKPYRRQIVISTGKNDWVREVTDENASLARYVSDVNQRLGKKKQRLPAEGKDKVNEPITATESRTIIENVSIETGKSDLSGSRTNSSLKVSQNLCNPAGVFHYAEASRLSILNGSQRSQGDDDNQHSVIVLPDYVVVSNVEQSPDGAEGFWRHALASDVVRAGTERIEQGLKTYVLPYNCLILLCSHKRRDNRCAVAAPKLENEFTQALHSEGWSVDTDIESLHGHDRPLEEIDGTAEEREEEVLRRLKALSEAPKKKALILKNSHIGGHKYAGNVIIYFPQGSSVWYGRVTTHEVLSVVRNTIIAGQILPPLLRGGLDISKPGCHSLLDW